MTFVGLASIVLGTPALAGLLHGPSSGLAWSWPSERRFYIENEVITPIPQFFFAERNYEVRVVAWQTRLVLRCASPEADRAKYDVNCRIDDVSLSAAAMPQDANRPIPGDDTRTQLGVIVEEMDAKLSGATAQLQMRRNGRILNVDLEGVTKSLERTAAIHETMRQVLARAIAGFDATLPPRGNASAGAWAQYSSLLLAMPTQYGGAGGSETIHKIVALDPHRVTFETRGSGVLSPQAGGSNFFDTRLEGFTTFDLDDRGIVDREWTVLGKATVSSTMSEGFAYAPPYGQRGWLQRLAPGETAPPMAPSREIAAPGAGLSTLQSWSPLSDVAPSQRISLP